MKFKPFFFGALSVLILNSTAYAVESNKTASAKPVNSWSCEDFLAVNESFQPMAVGFAEALNSKDKPEDAVLDFSGIEKVTPMIIQACQEDAKVSFKEKVRSEWDKVKKDM